MTVVYARNIRVGDRTYAVRPPKWGEWQEALAMALGADSAPDAALLLELCLLPCLYGPGGPMSRSELQALPAAAGDSLLAAAAELLEDQRSELRLSRADTPDGVVLAGRGLELHLRPWTFGERNRALSGSLRLQGGVPAVDLPAFERAMVCSCVTLAAAGEGRPLQPPEVADWPVPLGEAVVQVLDDLNGVDPGRDAVLKACLERGVLHPDLALFHLCRTFGWTPAVAEGLEARQVERLLSALRSLSAPAAGSGVTSAREGEVTRIIVDAD